jgi:hypothetical protein
MNDMERTSFLSVCLVSVWFPCSAQILQVTDAPFPGDHIVYSEVDATPLFAPGAAQTWVINGVVLAEVSDVEFITSAAGDGANYFPMATVAAYAISPSDTSTNYINTTAGGLDLLGSYSAGPQISYFSDPWRLLPYPCSFGTTWADGYTELDAPGGNVVYVQDPETYTADGYGELIVNGSITANVLKVHSTQVDTFSVMSPLAVGVTKQDVFWKPGFPFYLAFVSSSITFIDGEPIDTIVSVNVALDAVSEVTERSTRAIGLDLYPNPADAEVALVFSSAGISEVTVLDALGRVVLRRSLGNLSPGIHREPIDVSGFAPGRYVVRLTNALGEQGMRALIVQ